MEEEVVGVVASFQDFPPLYTEQINNGTLAKQLEIWQTITLRHCLEHEVYTLAACSCALEPFCSAKAQRRVNERFLVLIAQYLVDKGFAFYMHLIKKFTTENACTVWGALFSSTTKGGKFLALQQQQQQPSVHASHKCGGDYIDTLKATRDTLMQSNPHFGLFPYTLDEMCKAALESITTQITSKQIETVYFLFKTPRSSNQLFLKLPEEHLALLISTLVLRNRINVVLNTTVALDAVSTKHVGIQVL